jgi:hypothetical protein
MRTEFPPFVDLSPGTILRNLESDIAELRRSVRDLKEDLLVFEDLKQIKGWLKQMKRRQATALRLDEMPF